MTAQKERIRSTIRDRYAGIARQGTSCCGEASTCCSTGAKGESKRLGYSANELSAVPKGANMGLGCGNPQAIAALKKGERVLDLGSGGGFDCFLAARRVGRSGRVIGGDMTPEMVAKARENARKGRYRQVEFRLGEIEHLPVADHSVDVVLSNCVINLSPDKPQVYREAYRVLRRGGRVAISDVVALRPLPRKVRTSLEAHAGCVAGSATVRQMRDMLRAAGFTDLRITVQPESRLFIKNWFPGSDVEDYVRSATIEARK